MYLVFESASRTNAIRVVRNSKCIATVVAGSIQPKRVLSKDERKSIEAFLLQRVYDGLSFSPAIQNLMADTLGIEQTWPVQRRRAA